MRAKEFLDQVEFTLRQTFGEIPPDMSRLRLLQITGWELTNIASQADWKWARKWLEPVISTYTGQREYKLPEDFGENFVFGGDDLGERYVCMLDDGSNDSTLEYVAPEKFFSKNRTGASNSTPSEYTITRRSDGIKILHLDPPPDSNSDSHYTINGLYVPERWEIKEEHQQLPITGSYDGLLYGVLARAVTGTNPRQAADWQSFSRGKIRELKQREANAGHVQRLKVKLSRTGTGNDYTLMRR